MNPRNVLLTLLALAGLAVPAAAANRPARNVLLLIADDLGLQLGCYGDKKIRTPNIDRLAASGVRFTHAFAAVSSCSPSRSTLYTGLHTHTSGQYGLAHAEHNFHTRDSVQSLPRLLAARGYRTGILGKLHVLPRSVYAFDPEIDRDSGSRNVARTGEQAQRFFRDCGDRPFALVVGFPDPHRSARGFGNETSYSGVAETRYQPGDVTIPFYSPDRPEVRREWAEYYQAVSRLDQGVGLVLDALRQTGHADDTLVLFLSDNGPPFPGAKTTLYDPGIHLPLIISAPGQMRRSVTNAAMVSWIDVLPTILDWTGVKAPPELTGRSLLPILGAEAPAGWDVVYGSHQCHEVTMYYPMRMVRTRKHKYLRNLAYKLDFPFASDMYNSVTWQGILRRGDRKMGERDIAGYVHRPREELYDLETDPHELKNVAGNPKYAEVLADLRERLEKWQVRTRDPWLVKDRHE